MSLSAKQLLYITQRKQQRSQDIDIVVSDDNTVTFADGLTYRPSLTLNKLHNDNVNDVRCVMGPYGSGKTVGATCIDLILQAVRMPPCTDNVRRSRFAIIRNTYAELTSTTVKTWMDWLSCLGKCHLFSGIPISYKSSFHDKNGKVEIEVIFLSLDSEKDIKKLKSLELTSAVIEEACEIPEGVLDHLTGRVGRYPKSIDINNKPYKNVVTLVTNPPSDAHWIHKLCEEKRPSGYVIYHQPPGLLKLENGKWETNHDAENIKNLKEDYYLKFSNGKSEEFIKVFCNGEYGIVYNKQPVYSEYFDDMHSSDNIKYDEKYKIDLHWDYGLTPCVNIGQRLDNGWINIIGGVTSSGMGIEEFVNKNLLPYLNNHFPNWRMGFSVGDPAGAAGDPVKNIPILSTYKNNKPIVGHLETLGFRTIAAVSNSIVTRVDAVKKVLGTLIDGRPQLMISRDCTTLRQGFLGGYNIVNANKSDPSKYSPTPCKSFHSHIHDALQYGCLEYIDQMTQSADDFDYSSLSVKIC